MEGCERGGRRMWEGRGMDDKGGKGKGQRLVGVNAQTRYGAGIMCY